jgi:SAM-dependent methyltransferase
MSGVIARGFDRLAPFYDVLASAALLGAIHRSQVALLPQLPPVRRALVVGGGTGRFLAALLEAQPAAEVVSVDLSPGMTARTRRRVGQRAELRVGGLEAIGREEQFDLVATHCFLDLFPDPELAAVVTRLRAALADDGIWLFSDFRAPTPAAAALLAVLYAFFRGTCHIRARRLPDFQRAFAAAGLFAICTRHFAGGLLEAQLLSPSAKGTRGTPR